MRVDDRRPVRGRFSGNEPSQRRLKPGSSTKRPDLHAKPPAGAGPGPCVIEAADPHGNLVVQPGNDVEDQTFRTAGIEAEDDLENTHGASV